MSFQDFFEKIESSFILVLLSIVALSVMIVGLALIAALNSRRASRYNELLHRAELSAVRSSIEAELARRNYELTLTKDRWNEVNHLLISSHNDGLVRQSSLRTDNSKFLSRFPISVDDLKVDKNFIFILTPFLAEELEIYLTIRNACAEAGFRGVRGDEEHSGGDILTHIIKNILKARLVVANIGSRNPNVFYELGIAQALGKTTVLVAQNKSEIPFDVQSSRIFLFRDMKELEEKLPTILLKTAAGKEELLD